MLSSPPRMIFARGIPESRGNHMCSLPSRRQNRSATSACRNKRSGLYFGEAWWSGRRGSLWIVLLLMTLAGARPWALGQDPAVVGQFSSVMSWPFNPTHAVLLPSGEVFWWGSFAYGGRPEIWNPITNTNTAATQPGYNIFCGAHSLMGNGQVLVTGGDSALG